MKKLELKNAQQHSNFTVFSLLAVFIPFIGLVLGIIYLCKDKEIDRVLGKSTLLISVVSWGIAIILLSMV